MRSQTHIFNRIIFDRHYPENETAYGIKNPLAIRTMTAYKVDR